MCTKLVGEYKANSTTGVPEKLNESEAVVMPALNQRESKQKWNL